MAIANFDKRRGSFHFHPTKAPRPKQWLISLRNLNGNLDQRAIAMSPYVGYSFREMRFQFLNGKDLALQPIGFATVGSRRRASIAIRNLNIVRLHQVDSKILPYFGDNPQQVQNVITETPKLIPVLLTRRRFV